MTEVLHTLDDVFSDYPELRPVHDKVRDSLRSHDPVARLQARKDWELALHKRNIRLFPSSTPEQEGPDVA